MTARPTAAIVTVGTELVTGLSVDTNSAEVARALTRSGFAVAEAVSAGDDATLLAGVLRRLLAAHAMVVTTGGLGPTHDDVTRDAASAATGRPLERDEAVAEALSHIALRHEDPVAAEQVFRQALVLRGARVLPAATGTAPGQVLDGLPGTLALLPGPPAEMRPMLADLLGEDGGAAPPAVLGIAGMPEGDAQRIAERALQGVEGVTLGVLAVIGDVKVVLYDDGAGPDALAAAARRVADAFGEACYSAKGETLAEAVLAAARARGLKLAVAESCTGGMVAVLLTDVAGASDTFV
ncbi:MAG: hypothetical protein C0418_02475, partial [Coriobacteriaceae bacterium]|nr:hypothetical protein [Coriobacteriaceae bacterium]